MGMFWYKTWACCKQEHPDVLNDNMGMSLVLNLFTKIC